MKTIDEIKEYFAIEQGFDNWNNLLMNYSHNATAIIDHMEIVAERYAKQCCEEQRRLCASNVEIVWDALGETCSVNKKSILNAPSPC